MAFLVSKREEGTVEQTFAKPVNAGWQPINKEYDHKVNHVLFLITLSQHQQHQRL